MLQYKIIATLTDAETDNFYTEFKQDIYDSYNADEFENVVEQFNSLISFIKKQYDCEDTYELSAYILDAEDNAIY